MDILPDSRAKNKVTPVEGQFGLEEPYFCANCGKLGGHCLVRNMTFMFYLCPPCADTYGPIAGMYAMPDEVFFEKVREAQLEEAGRLLTPLELVKALDDPRSPLALLAKERLTHFEGVRTCP